MREKGRGKERLTGTLCAVVSSKLPEFQRSTTVCLTSWWSCRKNTLLYPDPSLTRSPTLRSPTDVPTTIFPRSTSANIQATHFSISQTHRKDGRVLSKDTFISALSRVQYRHKGHLDNMVPCSVWTCTLRFHQYACKLSCICTNFVYAY